MMAFNPNKDGRMCFLVIWGSFTQMKPQFFETALKMLLNQAVFKRQVKTM